MMSKFIVYVSASCAAFYSFNVASEVYGSVKNQSISDNATVCMNVGFTASLTGLDNIVLSTEGETGKVGAVYRATDQFHLQSNGAVSILIKGGELSLGDYKIMPNYKIDGVAGKYDTPINVTHDSIHTIEAEFEIKSISAQATGQYQGTIELLVVPQAGEATNCGASIVTYPTGEGIYGDTSTWATIAFEDLYPNSGDADYNDMVIRYNASETYNPDGELEYIELNYVPIARGAGFNHELYLDLNGEVDKARNISTETDPALIGDATVVVTYTNLENGNTRQKIYDLDDDVPIFLNTRQTLEGFANVYDGADLTYPREMTSVMIIPDAPELNLFGTTDVQNDPYRTFLYVNNTQNSIDLAAVNPDDGMIDSEGYPFGIIVPDEWLWPVEGVSIDDAYPYFAEYRAWLNGEVDTLSTEAEYWYLSPTTSDDILFDPTGLPDFSAYISD